MALSAAATDFAPWPSPTSLSFAESHQPGNCRYSNKVLEVAPWATPKHTDEKGGQRLGKGQVDLCHQAHAAPGPTTTSSTAKTVRRGVLDAAFSRWLMGFPPIWDAASPNYDDYLLALALVARDG